MIELSQWIDTLENINKELDYQSIIEKQLLKHSNIAQNLQGLRRKNTLIMASLCQYEQLLQKEIEFGKREYDVTRLKEHEKKRDGYVLLTKEFQSLKSLIYQHLCKFQRK